MPFIGLASTWPLGRTLRKRSGDEEIIASLLACPAPTTTPENGAGEYSRSFWYRSIARTCFPNDVLQQVVRFA